LLDLVEEALGQIAPCSPANALIQFASYPQSASNIAFPDARNVGLAGLEWAG